jgi:class 3 adenylate cyclase
VRIDRDCLHKRESKIYILAEGAVADAMNLAARLNAIAGPSEIVVSNLLHQALPDTERAAFTELEPVEAKNIARVRAWKLAAHPPALA